MEVRSLVWALDFKDKASSSIKKVNDSVDTTASKLVKLGDSMSKVGKGMTKKLTTPIMAVGAKALHSVSNFDDGMSRVRSLTGATGEDFDKLRKKAIKLGNDTAYSAQDASEMMQVLAASGMSTNDILETSGDIFSLMSAGSTDAETAASILTNTMAQFNLTASDSTAIVDTFAKGSSAAKLGVEELEYILGQAGGSLASMNMDMQQATASAGHLANAGMPIGQVGSALNAMVREVKSNAKEFKELGISVYDSQGKLKDLGSIMGELESKVGGMTNAQRDAALSSVFSGQAMKAATDWIGLGSEEYSKLTDEIYSASGASAEMAAINEDNIGGALRSLSSSLGTLMINIGDVIKGPVKSLAGWVQKITALFNNASPSIQKIIVAIGGVAAAIGPLLLVGGKISQGLGKLPGHLTKIKGLISPQLVLVGLIVGSLIYLWKTNEDFRNSVIRAWTNIKAIVSTVVGFLQGLWDKYRDDVISVFQSIWEFITTVLSKIIGVVSSVVSVITSTIGVISSILHGDWAGLKENLGDLFTSFVDILKNIFQAVWETIKGIVTGIGTVFIGLIKGIFGGIAKFISSYYTKLIQGTKSLIKGVVDVIVNLFQGFYDKFKGVFDALGQVIQGTVELFKNILLGPILLILDLITLDFEAFKEDAKMIWDNIIDAIKKILKGFLDYLIVIWEGVISKTKAAWEKIKQTISNVVEWLSTLPGRAYDSMVQLVKSMVEGIKSRISSLKSATKEAGNSIISSLKELPGKVVNIGKNIMTSLGKGIKSGIMAPVNAVKSVSSRIRGILGGGSSKPDGSHRTGLSRVPFDGYRAILHKDEEVLTANDPRNINNAGRQAVRNIDKQPSIRAEGQQVAFSPTVNINIEGNASEQTVDDISAAVQRELNNFFKKVNLQGV